MYIETTVIIIQACMWFFQDICSRTEAGGCGQSDAAKLALDIISIIGVILSGLGLILTILTVLLFK